MADDFSVDLSDIKRFENQLKAFAKLAVPIANQQALNDGAFAAMKIARNEQLPRTMILRNKFTAGSIKVDKATGLKMTQQRAIVGSVQEYLADQEFGAVKKPNSGADAVVLPTRDASREGAGAQPRRKLPRGKNRFAMAVANKPRGRFRNKKHRNIASVIVASKRTGWAILDTKRGRGLYRITGRKKLKVRLFYDLSKKRVKIDKNPWLKQTINKVSKQMPRFYLKRLEQQTKRLKLFKP